MRVLFPLLVIAAGCREQEYHVTDLVGGDGELRFNLVFTNEDAVDLDLHVITPADREIYYDEPSDPSGGALDVDCFCNNCEQGPNENVFWDYGTTPPAGEYEVAIEYFGGCGDYYDYYYGYGDTEPSDFTLRILEAGQVIEEYTGTLEEPGDRRPFTYSYQP